ncbi:conserved hypothetical protein [Paraburkholderia piptadeniae]|uniref:Lipoprotein n=1 Tax=Paraburkholderia piptadeniae TaxID=1701573 RepID=A0A1N7RYF9_9BURK|nr:hypothetical protein [Paraburkholderia piptadeniae]SIT40162.1 conserved hypothetical protein [Paraburkholderia piptadeniae]
MLFIAGCSLPQPMDSSPSGPYAVSTSGHGPEVVDGIDVWMRGTPTRPYDVVTQTTVTNWLPLPGGHGMRSKIVDAVRQAGGDAAIVYDTRTYRDSTSTNRHVYVSTIERAEIAIVRYR